MHYVLLRYTFYFLIIYKLLKQLLAGLLLAIVGIAYQSIDTLLVVSFFF